MIDSLQSPDPEPDSLAIDIAVLDADWDSLELDLETLCERAVTAANTQFVDAPMGELSIAFVDNSEIARLNGLYRGKDKPTNVLSFPADGHNPALGDIVIAREICQLEAREKHIAFCDHVTHLCIHGYLHLCGYDHETETDAELMEDLEIRALATLNIANPYEDKNV